jgi:hypothetical protein
MEPAKTEKTVQAPRAEGEHPRKPYTAPTLRRLGSVRDLTLGSPTGCAKETKGFRTM